MIYHSMHKTYMQVMAKEGFASPRYVSRDTRQIQESSIMRKSILSGARQYIRPTHTPPYSLHTTLKQLPIQADYKQTHTSKYKYTIVKMPDGQVRHIVSLQTQTRNHANKYQITCETKEDVEPYVLPATLITAF
jgi:hypothetical protein